MKTNQTRIEKKMYLGILDETQGYISRPGNARVGDPVQSAWRMDRDLTQGRVVAIFWAEADGHAWAARENLRENGTND